MTTFSVCPRCGNPDGITLATAFGAVETTGGVRPAVGDVCGQCVIDELIDGGGGSFFVGYVSPDAAVTEAARQERRLVALDFYAGEEE